VIHSYFTTYEETGYLEAVTASVEIKIDFTFTAGRPETGPSYASGGEPAEPATVEIMEIYVEDGKGWKKTSSDRLEDKILEERLEMFIDGLHDNLVESARDDLLDEAEDYSDYKMER
tara:strand:+ start:2269 stop:2619 length:351 start_codon:yes stop_codon:yes gene_type:complete